MLLNWFRIEDQYVSLRTLILIVISIPLAICLSLEVHCRNVLFRFGGIEYESISLLRLAVSVDLHLITPLHLLPFNIWQVVFEWLGV